MTIESEVKAAYTYAVQRESDDRQLELTRQALGHTGDEWPYGLSPIQVLMGYAHQYLVRVAQSIYRAL